MRFDLPGTLKPGQYELSIKAVFGTGETQEDDFTIHVLPRRSPPNIEGKVAVFDPKGETVELLKAWASMLTPLTQRRTWRLMTCSLSARRP